MEIYGFNLIYMLTGIEYFKGYNSIIMSILTSKLILYNFNFFGFIYSKIYNFEIIPLKIF
jgi:hypothetical protein